MSSALQSSILNQQSVVYSDDSANLLNVFAWKRISTKNPRLEITIQVISPVELIGRL